MVFNGTLSVAPVQLTASPADNGVAPAGLDAAAAAAAIASITVTDLAGCCHSIPCDQGVPVRSTHQYAVGNK
jgi:hypothetical protein